MESGSLRPATRVPRIPSQRKGSGVTVRAEADQSTPDEPTAVLIAGAHDGGKRELVRALLGRPARGGAGAGRPDDVPDVPPTTYLVMRYGPAGGARAYVPGSRAPAPYEVGTPGVAERRPARPPRRVEVSLPDPLLRHFGLVETPCARRLGVAGALVLAEAAERGGAVVFAAGTAVPLTRSELDLLAELATREVPVFFAIVPSDGAADDGGPDDGGPADRTSMALEAHQTAVARHAPALSGARWFAVDPVAGDVAYLRRALVEWAGGEALRRASANPPMPAGTAVPVGADAARSGWPATLDRWLHASTRAVCQRLAIGVANVHLRCVQEIVFGAGWAALPESLDRELHALSMLATAESDTAAATLVHDVLRRVLAAEPTEGVRRRVAAAVRRGLAVDAAGRPLPRVLLVTAGGAVSAVDGRGALAALPGYPRELDSPILPPVGLGVSADCYVRWGEAADADVGRARSWLHQATRAVELELVREVERRFTAVHRSLGGLIGESVDHGVLLA